MNKRLSPDHNSDSIMKDENYLGKFYCFFIILLIILPILSGFFYLSLFAVNIPNGDQWSSDIYLGIKFHDGKGLWSDLLQLHNDHRPVFPFIIMVSSHLVSNFNIITETFLSFFLYIISFIIISLIFLNRIHYEKSLIIALIPVSLYYFNFFEIGSLLWGLSIFYSVFLVCATAMFYLLDKSSGIDWKFIIAIISAVICMYSFSSGIFIWIGGFIVLILKNRAYKSKKLLIWIISSLIALYIYYFVLSINSTGIHGYSGYHDYLSNFIHYPIQKTFCFFSTLGSNIIHNANYATFAGVIISLIILGTIYLNIKNLDFPNTAVWYGLLVYSVFVSILLTLSRSGNGGVFGPVDMLIFIPDNRHFPSTILLLVGLFFLILHYYLEEKKDTEKRIKSKKVSLIPFIQKILFIGVIITILIFGATFHFIPGIIYGERWYLDNVDIANKFLIYDELSDEDIHLFYTDKTVVTWTGKYFKEHKLNVFDPINQDIYVNNSLTNPIRDFIKLKSLPIINKEYSSYFL